MVELWIEVEGGRALGQPTSSGDLLSLLCTSPKLSPHLPHISPTPPQVCSAIRDLISTGHTPLLSEEQVDNITKSLATPDERKMLAAYRPPAPAAPAAPTSDDGTAPQTVAVPELGRAEQLLLGLMAIPSLEEKLGAVKLVNSFRPRIEAVSEAATTLYDACKVGLV